MTQPPQGRVPEVREHVSVPSRRTIGTLETTLAGLGCGTFGEFIGERSARDVVAAALDVGVRHFDTADVYGGGDSERFLGAALGGRRSEVVITTKFGAMARDDGVPPASAAAVTEACEASLRRLGTDWIDLYLVHHPDPQTPISETLTVLERLRQAGKVREVGCSNFTPEQLREAHAWARSAGVSGFAAIQNSYSLLDRTPEQTLMPVCTELGTAFIPYLPLGGGLLTGKYQRTGQSPSGSRMQRELRGMRVSDYFPAALSDESFDVIARLEEWAARKDRSLLALALAWLASAPNVAGVIAGATSPDQVRANSAATNDWQLSSEEQAELASITTTEVSYVWHAGVPSYSRPPSGFERAPAPDIRAQR